MRPEIDFQKIRNFRLMIATPQYGNQCFSAYKDSCLRISHALRDVGVAHSFEDGGIGDALISRARNRISRKFRLSDATHILWLDADIAIDPYDVLTLLNYDFPVIGGPYAKKEINWNLVAEAAKRGVTDPQLLESAGTEFVFNIAPNNGSKYTAKISLIEPVEVLQIGTGFMMVKQEVFEAMEKNLPELRYNAGPNEKGMKPTDHFYNYFGCEIDRHFDSGMLLSEDWFFCDNARRLGFKIHICPWMVTRHVGTYSYKCSIVEHVTALDGEKQYEARLGRSANSELTPEAVTKQI